MRTVVSKFGGTSLADAEQIRKVVDIVRADPDRRIVVVSAPGKRESADRKVTDLLIELQGFSEELHRPRYKSVDHDTKVPELYRAVEERFTQIITGLGLSFNLEEEIQEIKRNVAQGASYGYVPSRGEYLCAKIIAEALGYEFVDSAYLIRFDGGGRFVQDDARVREILGERRVVIPGFYGSIQRTSQTHIPNNIVTFPRGGSDITGAIIARAVDAMLYENWTDVPGLLMADPRIVTNPQKIETVSYGELRELAYMGAGVFHEEAMFPVREKSIFTQIRNTNDPTNSGTLVVPDGAGYPHSGTITGISGKEGFTVITINKALMNSQVGFAAKILLVLQEFGISFEHMPTGIDSMSIIVHADQLRNSLGLVLRHIREACEPNSIEVSDNMAIICTVGRRMRNTVGVAARILSAVAEAGISTRLITQSANETNVMIGVKGEDYHAAIRAIYTAFVE